MTVGIVVVSHSRALAEAAVALAGEMLQDGGGPIEVAAGLDDGGFGTDAIAISEAVARADRGDGVVVLMDMGSAVLAAELALEMVDDDVRDRVVLTPAPLVEGLVVASVGAAGGASVAEVAAEAGDALAAKAAHLGPAAAVASAPGTGPAPDDERGVFTVALPHGLHARPSARLVRALGGLDAEVRLRNVTLDGPEVSAASLSKVATLGALQGHEVAVRAHGPDAAEAVRRLLELAAEGFGEAPDTAGSPPPAARTGGPIPASPGIGIGPVRVARPASVAVPAPRAGTPSEHHDRLEEARTVARGDLVAVRDTAAREIGAAEAAVFDAQLLLLDDPDLLADAAARIDAGADAARAWADAVDGVERAFADAADAYLRARAGDVRDVRDRVLRALGGVPADNTVDDAAAPDGILVADDLTPAAAAALDPARTPAVLLAAGSPTAHAAILLRARGVPAVVGGGAALVARAGAAALLAVDGSTGEVVVDPDEATLAVFRERAAALAGRRDEALRRAHEPAVTRDGTTVLVGANVGSAADARAATGADLAGLVRTEFGFLGRSEAPDVDDQEASYRAVAEAMADRRITLRTLDVGGDKPLAYLPMPAEANPFLGVRGIRLALARPRVLADQLEAIVRVAHDHPVDVMFPMVATVDELTAARRALDDAIATVGRGRPADLRVGIMVEVPAAALKAAAFAPHVDFFSIGTNDLTQYTLAAERGNDQLAALADALDPGVLALVAATVAGAGPDVLVAVCGELAGDEQAVPLLIGLGVRELSVAPGAVAGVKRAVRDVEIGSARDLAAAALACPDAGAVRELLGP